MSAHTPGPWTTKKGTLHVGIICPDGLSPLASSRPSQERAANQRLIAAAPALLEALQAMLASHTYRHDEDDAREMARAAIAQAKGESK